MSRKNSKLNIYRQVQYYKELHFNRTRILYEIKRRMKSSWNQNKVVWVDEALAGIKPIEPVSRTLIDDVARLLRKKIRIIAKGSVYTVSYKLSSESLLNKKIIHLDGIAKELGFKHVSTRGDDGYYMLSYKYAKFRNTEIYLEVEENSKRKANGVTVTLKSYNE